MHHIGLPKNPSLIHLYICKYNAPMHHIGLPRHPSLIHLYICKYNKYNAPMHHIGLPQAPLTILSFEPAATQRNPVSICTFVLVKQES